MKNLIYQYWDGNILPGVRAGVANMKAYAKRIGAEYLFEENPRFVTNLGAYSPHYGAFKPVFTDSFHEYDNVLFADTDVFAVDGLAENIFEQYNAEIGICTEPLQPKFRASRSKGITTGKMDKDWAALIKSKWGAEVPRTEEGLPKVYNSGVVLYSNAGLKKARERFVPFAEYVRLIKSHGFSNFYTCDQPYIHAMLEVCDFDWVEMDNEWNRFITYIPVPGAKKGDRKPSYDPRTENTKFVHIQMSGADHYDADTHWRITNLPVNEWGNDRSGKPFFEGTWPKF
ncbi:MAG: hypothetical protein ACQ9ET_00530 [Nitrosomonadaceae bacterium]